MALDGTSPFVHGVSEFIEELSCIQRASESCDRERYRPSFDMIMKKSDTDANNVFVELGGLLRVV